MAQPEIPEDVSNAELIIMNAHISGTREALTELFEAIGSFRSAVLGCDIVVLDE